MSHVRSLLFLVAVLDNFWYGRRFFSLLVREQHGRLPEPSKPFKQNGTHNKRTKSFLPIYEVFWCPNTSKSHK